VGHIERGVGPTPEAALHHVVHAPAGPLDVDHPRSVDPPRELEPRGELEHGDVFVARHQIARLQIEDPVAAAVPLLGLVVEPPVPIAAWRGPPSTCTARGRPPPSSARYRPWRDRRSP